MAKKDDNKVAFSLRLPEPLYTKLKKQADTQKRSLNRECELLLEREFARR